MSVWRQIPQILLLLLARVATVGSFLHSTKLPPHPRVRMTSDRLATLRSLVQTDAEAKSLFAKVEARAQHLLALPPVKYGHSGVEHSLLAVSREVCDRLYSLGLSYLISGNKEHATRAVKEMVAVAGFPDWNPGHFLDTAEMTHCVGIGYDWTFDAIAPADRATIEQGVATNGLEAYLAAPPSKWARPYWNWNQVVNGGLTAGALAFADALPAVSAAVLGNASKGVQSAFGSYAPAGAWTEGVGYWGYGTNYALVYVDAMQTATGSDGGASASPGLNETGLFCLHSVGLSWTAFNWGDSSGSCDQAVVAQLAALYPTLRPVLSAFARELRAGIPDPTGNSDTASVLLAACGPVVGTPADIAALPKSAVFVERAVGSLRSAWLDRNGTWLAFKGCRGHYSHNDLDGGTFVLEMGGVRWAVDLGSDSYGLQGYWSQSSKPGSRYSFYRKSTRGHNTLTFRGSDTDPSSSNQNVEAMTNISAFHPERRSASVNLTDAYAGFVSSAMREFTLSADYTQLVVFDQIEPNRASQASQASRVRSSMAGLAPALTWSMHTYANITVDADGRGATLEQSGRLLRASVDDSSPAGRFESVDLNITSLPSNQSTVFKPSPGLHKLVFEASVVGNIRVTLKLQPPGQ